MTGTTVKAANLSYGTLSYNYTDVRGRAHSGAGAVIKSNAYHAALVHGASTLL